MCIRDSLLDLARERAGTAEPVAVRDWALLETLYATGVRVSEVCSAVLTDLDLAERTMHVVGKGDKERVVPFGLPARDALAAWLDVRPQVAHATSPGTVFLGVRGGHRSGGHAQRCHLVQVRRHYRSVLHARGWASA